MASFKFLLIFCVLITSPAIAQFEVGNGGDLIECRPEPGVQFKGLYSLDFIVSFESGAGMAFFEPVPEDPLAALGDHLLAQSPAIGEHFRRFLTNFQTQYEARAPDRFADFAWYPRDQLREIQDEYLFDAVPDHCKNLATGQITIKQAVVRTERGAIAYQYDISLFDDLVAAQRQLQLSHLVVHEWLWNFAPNSVVIRDANRFIHSAEFRQLKKEQVRLALENIGLVFQGNLPRPVYHLDLDSYDVNDFSFRKVQIDPRTGAIISFTNTIEARFKVHFEARHSEGTVWNGFRYFTPPGQGGSIDNYFIAHWLGPITVVRQELVDGMSQEVGDTKVVFEIVDYRNEN